jgi:excisionase family DNA binding protein
MNTVSEIAKRLRVSTRHVYSLVESGKLPCYRIGSAIRISDEQYQTYLDGCRREQPTVERPKTLKRLKV